MDKFVIKVEKNSGKNSEIHNIIKGVIEKRETVFIYGEMGIGKTYTITNLLKKYGYLELNSDLLRKDGIYDRLKTSETHLYIDNIDEEGCCKELLEKIKEGKKISSGCLIIGCKNVEKYNFCKTINFPKLTEDKIYKIAKENFPKLSKKYLTPFIQKCNGNIRNLLASIQFNDIKDEFLTPKEYVSKLLCQKQNDYMKYLRDHMSDHGHMWDMVHENYVDSKNANMEKISELMSQSDLYDEKIYYGNWDLLNYFFQTSLIEPAILINGELENIRSGSCWTKFGNFKARKQKFDAICRNSNNKINLDFLNILRIQLEKEDISTFVEYKLKAPDLDVINHMFIKNKLKPKNVTKLKKLINNVYDKT